MCVANIALWKRNTCISVIWNVPSIAKHRRWPPGHCVHLVWGEWAAPPVHCFHHCAWQNTSLQRASQKGPPEPKHLSTKNELPHEFPLSKGIPAMFWFSSSHRVFFRVTFRGIIKQRRWKEITLKRHDIVHIIYREREKEWKGTVIVLPPLEDMPLMWKTSSVASVAWHPLSGVQVILLKQCTFPKIRYSPNCP